ncbi:MAG: YggS family pyridoxal phosphate-dependent enzyme [Magnetococcales bacterium]|nr:YggS family pyridoxal phosphate-dependent enzyme [Magnetococcales bacterium]
MSDAIVRRLHAIQERIALACQRSGRPSQQVRLLAVSKGQPALHVQAAVTAGQRAFGENRVMEAREKIAALPEGLQWHLIGPLQRNKAKWAVTLFQMLHSVDSWPLAQALVAAGCRQSPLPILMQVNIGREPQKQGIPPEEAEDLARAISTLPGLALQGLMAIPPQTAHPEAARPYFRALAALARHIEAQAIPGVRMDELSMGMSHDFEVAIEEGATWIRVGSALFDGP